MKRKIPWVLKRNEEEEEEEEEEQQQQQQQQQQQPQQQQQQQQEQEEKNSNKMHPLQKNQPSLYGCPSKRKLRMKFTFLTNYMTFITKMSTIHYVQISSFISDQQSW